MGLAKDEKEGPVVETNKAEGKVVQDEVGEANRSC